MITVRQQHLYQEILDLSIEKKKVIENNRSNYHKADLFIFLFFYFLYSICMLMTEALSHMHYKLDFTGGLG